MVCAVCRDCMRWRLIIFLYPQLQDYIQFATIAANSTIFIIASGVPADIVGVWSGAGAYAWQRISSGGWLSAVLGRVFPALRVPLVSVSVCCLLAGSYAWGVMCYAV